MPDGVVSSLGTCPLPNYHLHFFMPHRFPIQTSRTLAALFCLAALALAGCAVSLPPAPASNPADPHGPAAATAPLRPTLLATSRTYLSSRADDREQKAKQTDMSQMKEGAMSHDMQGMSHQDHDMGSMQSAPTQAPAPSAAAYFTCPMHPEIHESKPGQCPKCGMTLVKKSGTPEGGKP